jgi:hypothetical protein
LAFDGRVHHLEKGYWIKFEIKKVAPSAARPHGLSYAFTLHAPDGRRLVGFDNAHGVAGAGARFKKRLQASDHWHRTEGDTGTDPTNSSMRTRCFGISSGRCIGP